MRNPSSGRLAALMLGITLAGATISGTPAAAAEYSFPIRWNARGWIFELFPHDEQFFLDGGLIATLDVLTSEGDGLDWSVYTGAGFYVGMGYHDDGAVVFDPYDAHYSLIFGGRFEWSDHIARFEYDHDCFHDVDREDETSEIWNLLKIEFLSRDYFPRYRREEWTARKGSGLILETAWSASVSYFPRWKLSEYIQHRHDFSIALGGGLKIAFAHRGPLALELRPDVLYFIDRGGGWTWKNDLLLYLSWYGSGGTACLFTGPRWDNQQIKPSGDRWLVGLDFYL